MAKEQVQDNGSDDTSDTWNKPPRRKPNRRRRKDSSDSAWDEDLDDNKQKPVPIIVVEEEPREERNTVNQIENDEEISSGGASDWFGSGDEKKRRRRPIRRRKAAQSDSDGWDEDDTANEPSSSKRHPGRKPDSHATAGSVFEQHVLLSRNSRLTETTGILELASLLGKTGVDGPQHYHRADMMTRKKLAGGAQFDVYIDLERDDRRARIYKVVKVVADNNSFSLVRRENNLARQRFNAIKLEILALSHPPIRNSRNIIKLLGWGYNYPNTDPNFRLPVLILERAEDSLASFLKTKDCTWDVKYQICLDVFDGIATLHRWDIVQGDVKPDNILICTQDDPNCPYVAKISDFGLCISLEEQAKLSYTSYAGTTAWNAREIQANSKAGPLRDPRLLLKCDAFSLALLAVSVLVSKGDPPFSVTRGDPAKYPSTAVECLNKLPSLPADMKSRFTSMLRTQLDANPENRRDVTCELIKIDDSPTFGRWFSSRTSYSSGKTSKGSGAFKPMDSTSLTRFWCRMEEPTLQPLLDDIDKTRNEDGGFDAPVDTLFGASLAFISLRPAGYEDKVLDWTLNAARGGHIIAQTLCERIHHALGKDLPSSISSSTRIKWLFNGAATGSLIAFRELTLRSADEARRAKTLFRSRGGYNVKSFFGKEVVHRLVFDETHIKEQTGPTHVDDYITDLAGNRLLHRAAICGDAQGTKTLLDSFGASPDVKNDQEEIPLLQACLAGHADVVHILLDHGAKPSMERPYEGLTPLHLLFNFDTDDIPSIAHSLFKAGANLEALVRYPIGLQSLPAFHFPFQWPFGTPFHWASWAQSEPAMKALLALGADINARDTLDDKDQTALSMAANRTDLQMVNWLLKAGANPKACDQTGRNALHLLALDYMVWSRGEPLWKGFERWIYCGNKAECQNSVDGIFSALCKAGCDPQGEAGRTKRRPIEIALEAFDCNTIASFLDAGITFCMESRKFVIHQESPSSEWIRIKSHRVIPFGSLYFPTLQKIIASDTEAKDTLHSVVASKDNPNDETLDHIRMLLDGTLATMDVNGFHPRTGVPPILDAAESGLGAIERVNALINHGADVWLLSKYDESVFLFLCKNSDVKDQDCYNFYMKYVNTLPQERKIRMINLPSTRDAAQNKGLTTLHCCANNAKLLTLRALLKDGVEVNPMLDRTKYTPMDSALNSAEVFRRYAIRDAFVVYHPESVRKDILQNGTISIYAANSDPEILRYQYRSYPEVIKTLITYGGKRAVELGVMSDHLQQPSEFDKEKLHEFPSMTGPPDLGIWQCLYEYEAKIDALQKRLMKEKGKDQCTIC